MIYSNIDDELPNYDPYKDNVEVPAREAEEREREANYEANSDYYGACLNV